MSADRQLLAGRVAVIAGGGRGIGASLSELFASLGASTVVVDLEQERAQEVAERIGAEGGVALPVCADLRDPAQIAELVDSACKAFGTIDVLVNNAGGSFQYVGRKPLTEYADEDWDHIVDRNLRYVFLTSRAVIPVMIAGGGGSIVNIATIIGMVASPFMAAYGAAKAGVINLTRTLAVEFGPQGIRANSISLGHIEVPAGAGAPDRDAAGVLPLRRFGAPAEIAQVAAFLASDMSSYVTGENIVVDGGASALNVFTLSHTSAR